MSLVIKSEKEFDELVLHSKDVLCIVYFHAAWCGPCKMFAKTYEDVSGRVKEEVRMFKLDIDLIENIPANYSILSIPTLIAFKNGGEIAREIGVPSDLEGWIVSNK